MMDCFLFACIKQFILYSNGKGDEVVDYDLIILCKEKITVGRRKEMR